MADRLTLQGVTKSFGPISVLEPTNLTLRDGEFLTILGPSGSGKTTILRLIAGFLAPSSGRILFDGRDITTMHAYKRPFNTVFQDYALFPHMTVAGNIGYGPMVRGLDRAEIRRRVAEVLEIVELTGMSDRHPKQLSGGQRQRVALARAIINEPDVILLDEPLAALDAGLRRQMQVFLKEVQRRIGITFLFVTHDQEEAITLSDRIVVMNHGRVAQTGTPSEIYHGPSDLFVAKFFGDINLLSGEAMPDRTVRTAVGVLCSNHARLGKVVVAIRPEMLSLRPCEGATRLSAVVKGVTFTGPILRVELTAGEGSLIAKVVGGEAALVPPPGGVVQLSVPSSAVHLIPAP